jgi:CheY-like chemotaxis protein
VTSAVARILVVDDDPVDRMIIESLLTQDGHDLSFAEDGAAGLARYQKKKFDLVVTDLMMPNVNGLRMIKELMAFDPKAKIIAISGTSAQQLPLAEDYGAVGILRKPVQREPLLKAVNAALGGKASDK